MLEFARWKYTLVALMLIASVIYAAPNLFPQDPAVQVSATRNSTVDAALQSRVSAALERSKIEVVRAEIKNGSLLVRLPNPEAQLLAADLLRKELKDSHVVALNLASNVPDWLVSIGATPMVLGLDLQGGVHFLMEVDQRATLEKRENAFADDIRALLRNNDVGYVAVNRTNTGIEVQLREAADRNRAAQLVGRDVPELQVSNGATEDLLIAKLLPAQVKAVTDSALEQNVGTLRTRINSLGVAEPIIQRQGTSRIVVQLPGVQDTALAKKILGATATLEWRAVVGEGFTSAMEAANTGRVPPDARLYYMRPDSGVGGKGQPVLLSKRVITSGDQLVDARSGFEPQDGSPMVSIKLDNAGGARMLEHTTDNVGKQMGVVFIERTPESREVNGEQVRSVKVTEEVISMATTQGVFGKNFQITGLESSAYASELALLMRAGSLAAPVDIVEERVIGPSMGQDNIDAGKDAILIGFAAVCLLMVLYYKWFGVISVVALFTNLLMLAALLSLFNATLTMPGIAGIVLTLGMAIDGNVLIIERIREELRNGNTPVASIKAGYERAWTVILDSNITKLIAALALFSFGSGPVRGFAVVLGLGVLTSMFTSVTVSRAMATLIYGGRRKVTRVSV